MKKVLIMGSDNVLGKVLLGSLSSDYEIHCTSRRSSNQLYLDALDLDSCEIDFQVFDIVINLIGISKFSMCDASPEIARQINVEFPIKILRLMRSKDSRFLQMSTSAIFSCNTSFQNDDSKKVPSSVYGKQKLEAESMLLETGRAEIFRISKIINRNDLLGEMAEKLGRGLKVSAFEDLYFCPLILDHFQKAIGIILECGQQKVYQLSGSHDISYADALFYIAQKKGLDLGLIEEISCSGKIKNENVLRYTSMLPTPLIKRMIDLDLDSLHSIEACYV